jgi:hypothetical protein
MKRYDPDTAPNPEEWLALDEDERILLVKDFHRRARVQLPNANVHAAMHVAVENQIALGDSLPVKRELERLKRDGLDRHDAVHAIASVLADHMFTLVNEPQAIAGDPNEAYKALSRLTAHKWRSS